MSACKQITFTDEDFEYLTSNTFLIPAINDVIDEDAVLKTILFNLSPALCTRSRTARIMAAKKPSGKGGAKIKQERSSDESVLGRPVRR